MARGNFRSGKDHGVAERGSANRRIINGYVMKPVSKHLLPRVAADIATNFEADGYRTGIRKNRKGEYVVYRTLRKGQTRCE